MDDGSVACLVYAYQSRSVGGNHVRLISYKKGDPKIEIREDFGSSWHWSTRWRRKQDEKNSKCTPRETQDKTQWEHMSDRCPISQASKTSCPRWTINDTTKNPPPIIEMTFPLPWPKPPQPQKIVDAWVPDWMVMRALGLTRRKKDVEGAEDREEWQLWQLAIASWFPADYLRAKEDAQGTLSLN